TLKYPSDSDEG
nr:Chain T, CdnA3 Core peptide [Chryseobacterium gregarium DSM 19109]